MTKKERIADQINRMDRIIEWVKTCDNKTSIVMTIALLVPTFVIGTDWVLAKLEKLVTPMWCAISNHGEGFYFSWINCAALVLFVITLIFVGNSLSKFIRVLNAKIKEDSYGNDVKLDSLIHFRHIAKIKDYKTYRELVDEEDEEKYYEDLLSQTYINAKRCTEKFEDYKSGITWLCRAIISLALFIVSLLFVAV